MKYSIPHKRANLSDTYFTNRQDRYVLIKNCKGIADYYDRLITELGKFSFTLNNEGELVYCGAEGTNPNESEVTLRLLVAFQMLVIHIQVNKATKILKNV